MGQLAAWLTDSVAGTGGVEFAVQQPTVLASGFPAPNFCLLDADMEPFELAEAWQKDIVVLHFYLHDKMPLSVRQAISFSDHEEDFHRYGARVVGVSLDDCSTHADFRDEHGLSFSLLSDADGTACKLYRVWQDARSGEAIRPAVQRATFIVGNDGRLWHVEYKVDVQMHTDNVLDLLENLSGRKNGNRKEHRRHA